ncbi:PREDICTED: uncharacterized protein LOC106553663 [Thamnophis sirtalis]|uniref:Uncharacterized protein LOC106553663 n=1 Tax=Thamnophis sirtalis TaxID=35019 RepID=A0A6I9YUL3_9SAUR|nr:PREDICTED: uncharacterized protein LOC106553663 [Thamnophis sirtalis]
MASALPLFAPYGTAGETWEGFLECFECYLIASKNHNQPQEEKCSFFLSCCSPAMFASARALASPRPIYQLSWETLMAKLKNHYAPTPSHIAHRYAFRQCVQKPAESISQFLESLCITAMPCDFGDLEDNLVEQFVCRVKDIRLCRRLLSHPEITLQQAVDEARAAEFSEQSMADMQRLQPLHQLQPLPPPPPPPPVCPPLAAHAFLIDELVLLEDPSSEQVAQLRAQPWRPPPSLLFLPRLERNYSQIDKEALAAVSRVKKFHDYLYGRHFTLVTDHKPLLGLLAGDKPTAPILSPRMTRWTEFLAAYSYMLLYRPGKQLGHADALSRCPLPDSDPAPVPSLSILLIASSGLPLSAADIAAHTKADPVLAQRCRLMSGRLREARIHVDFAGLFHGQTFLIMVDAYSHWVELVLMTSTSAESTVQVLRCLFATHRLPDVVVSDNGPQFTSTTFQVFLALQGIWHAPTAPVEFLGFLIDAQGIHPTPSKIAAIRNAPTPSSKAELQEFLGLLNFYTPYVPHKASLVEPLHRLLDRSAVWCWGSREAHAFAAVKDTLTSAAVLVQNSDKLPLTLACNASRYGLGAVLSHVLPNGSEAPVAFYSQTLSAAEQNYSQIDKEALAAVSRVKKFHDYLYGRHFTLVTDHKPILGLLAGDKPTPPILSPRMTRWTAFLAAYSYMLLYRLGKHLGHADALSRCPLPDSDPAPVPSLSVLLIASLGLPLSAADIAAHTKADPVLAQVLSLLHKDHPGLARSYVWWPLLDSEIEACMGRCSACQLSCPNPPAVPTREWEAPRGPWSRLHVDFADPFHGQTFLIMVDAYSRWVELVLMTSTSAESTVQALRCLFATHGLQDVVVSNNGPQFTSTTFQEFLAVQGIRHMPTALYHPACNGRAECVVRSAKEALGRMDWGDWQTRVAAYLLTQHSTPCPMTNKSPAELLMGRRLQGQIGQWIQVEAPPGSAKEASPRRDRCPI